MNTTRYLGVTLGALVLLGVVLVTAGGATTGPLLGDRAGLEETAIHDLDTEPAECDDPTRHNASTTSVPYLGDRQLSVNNTVPVNHLDTTLAADLQEVGPHRYLLNVERVPGSERADCYAEARFNATLNISHPERYTLLVAYDGRVRHVVSSDPDRSGVHANVLPAAPGYQSNRSVPAGSARGSSESE